MWKLVKRYKIVTLIALILNLIILPFGLTFTDESITLPGGLNEVNSVIKFETDNPSSGSISSIFIITPYRATNLEVWWASNFDRKSNVYTVSEYSSYYSSAEKSLQGSISYSSSINQSLIVSYAEAIKKGYDYSLDVTFNGAVISGYKKGTTVFQVGDLITSVNGIKASTNEEEFIDAFNDTFNKYITNSVITFERDNKEYTRTLSESDVDSQSGIYRSYTNNGSTSTPSYSIKDVNVGGPSGGLLQTLSIYNSLVSEDITFGKKISGTGTINVYGEVGQIGGIAQKIYTADKSDVEVFFCPVKDYPSALQAYNTLSKSRQEHMSLVKVATFTEAINYLESMGA